MNITAICAARHAALSRMQEVAAALRATFDLADDADRCAKGAHGGWHSPRTDRGEEAARNRLFSCRFDEAESLEAYPPGQHRVKWGNPITQE